MPHSKGDYEIHLRTALWDNKDMSFSDWWAAFLAVASAAFALLLTDNNWSRAHPLVRPMLWTLSAILLGICLFSLVRKRTRTHESKPISQTTHGTSSPSGAVGSIGSIGPGAHVNIGTNNNEVKRVESKPRKTPLFEFVGLARRLVYINIDPRHGVHEPTTEAERQLAIPVFTACFTNIGRSDGTSFDGFNVIAKLRFFSDNWVKHKDIEYAVWIGSAAESTSLDVGHTEEIFLLGQFEGRKFCLRDRRKNQLYYSQWGEDIQYVEDITVDGFPHVEVMLIDGRSHVSRTWLFRVETQGDGASATLHDVYPPATAVRLRG
jgi:hypothetical protein